MGRLQRMLRLMFLSMAFAVVAGSLPAQELTIERITSPPYLSGTSPVRPTWSPDGSRLAFLWNDKAQAARDVWVASATSEAEPLRVTDFGDAGVSEVVWTPNGKRLIVVSGGSLYRIDQDGTGLTDLGASGRSLAFSPDGKFLSFIKDGDLWLWNEEHELVRATRVAKPKIGNSILNTCCGSGFSRPDVEVSGYQWSPDGRYIALRIDDRSQMREIIIPNYLGKETVADRVRRDYPGDNDHSRELAVYSVRAGKLRKLNLPDATDRSVANFAWSPNGNQLLVDQYPQNAEDRWLFLADPEDGSLREVWHDYRATRVSSAWNSTWQSDGEGIVFISDKDGRHHLYSLDLAGGGDAKRLTSGDWSVVGESGRAFLWNSPRTKEVFFVSTQESPYERHVYRMSENGGSIRKITSTAGVHHPYPSPDGSKVALLHSNDMTPTELYIADSEGGSAERRVTNSPPAEFAQYDWVEPRYVTFKSHLDGVTLHGRLLEPPNLDKSKKHPVILGPVYPNSVRKRWGDRQIFRGLYSLIQQYFVLEGGYIVFQVDTRGSVGHGRPFREALIRDYGGIDIEDLYSGLEYLKTLPYVDAERVGMWGSSYGGLMTAMSLFKKPGVYKAGVASAPATNVWHAMTGQVNVAGRPNTHPEVYKKVSAYSYGEDLEDHLMIVHGMGDSVVLFKDSIALAEKLMKLGKDFEFVVIPNSPHEWTAKDYNARYGMTRLAEHFDRYLK